MAPIPPWSDLPPELLSAIAKFLDPNPIDLLRFRAVCKSWLSCFSLPRSNLLSPIFPLTIPSPPHSLCSRYISPIFESQVVSVTVVYALRLPHGAEFENSSSTTSKTWIAFLNELNTGNVSIREPFTKANFELPLDFPRKLNLVDFHVSEIGRYYNHCCVYNRGGMFRKSRTCSGDVHKVVFSSNGSAVVVLFDGGKLGLLMLGAGDTVMDNEWQVIHDGKRFRLDDIVEFKGRVLGIDRRGRVYEMSYYSSQMNVIVPPITGGGGRRKRLVESLGLLHLVVRCNDRGTSEEMGKYRVYVLDEDIRKWVEVTSISDRIFFFGFDFSFSSSAEEVDYSFGRNCIIFNEGSFRKYDGGYGDTWLVSRTPPGALRVGLYHLEAGARLRTIESCPGYSNILWPPPTWLWINDKSKFLGTCGMVIERLLSRVRDENLKAKYKDLSPLVGAMVGAIVSGVGLSQQDVRNIWMEADMLNKFLNELVVEIEKEVNTIIQNMAENSMARRRHSESINKLNQAGTISHGTEDTNGGVNTVQKATQNSSGKDDWRSSEMTRRLGTLGRLEKVLFKGFISILEEIIDKSKGVTEPKEQASISGVEEARLSQSSQLAPSS